MSEAKQAMKDTLTGAAFESLCLQVGSERAWRMAYEWELKYRDAMRKVHELERVLRKSQANGFLRASKKAVRKRKARGKK